MEWKELRRLRKIEFIVLNIFTAVTGGALMTVIFFVPVQMSIVFMIAALGFMIHGALRFRGKITFLEKRIPYKRKLIRHEQKKLGARWERMRKGEAKGNLIGGSLFALYALITGTTLTFGNQDLLFLPILSIFLLAAVLAANAFRFRHAEEVDRVMYLGEFRSYGGETAAPGLITGLLITGFVIRTSFYLIFS
ncbi:hypothetical protein CR205_17665 [Alteribacter lacisalsi]|uniref:Uncharacterized protein n=1 Tax=Alteribacter lacisalsi TaxID=2045244 RepID=A0A2W0H7W6_9BACI|nr:hypothetical protein [Alteribacter lacisalsi]PYZ96190.1 hypothetical protein CR205_17665 [Alteribacter lacisalsi]